MYRVLLYKIILDLYIKIGTSYNVRPSTLLYWTDGRLRAISFLVFFRPLLVVKARDFIYETWLKFSGLSSAL